MPAPHPGDTILLFGSFRHKPRGAVVLEIELADGRTISPPREIDTPLADRRASTNERTAVSDLSCIGAEVHLAAIDD